MRTRSAPRPDGRFDFGPASSVVAALGQRPGEPRSCRTTRRARAPADRRQPRALAGLAATGAVARPPAPGALRGDPQLLRCRVRRGQQHDLRAPPPPGVIALGFVSDQASDLQVVKPPLNALAVRAHEPRPLGSARRDRAPAHHRRQPDDKLLDRTRKPRRARRVPEPEQVPLDRIRPGLQPIVTRRDTAAFTPRASDERTDHDAAGLGRQRRPRRPVPDTARVATRSGEVLQRHRQRPRARIARHGQRRRADARGAAGRTTHARAAAPSGARQPAP